MSKVTKGSKSQQLSVKQQNAIDLIIQGNTDEEVSKSVGVARSTVTKWRNHNPKFIAGLNRRRQDIWGGAIEKLRFLVSRAVDVLAEDLDSEDLKLRQASAIHILKATALYGSEMPSIPPETEENGDLLKEVLDMAQEYERERFGENTPDYDINDRKCFVYHKRRRAL